MFAVAFHLANFLTKLSDTQEKACAGINLPVLAVNRSNNGNLEKAGRQTRPVVEATQWLLVLSGWCIEQ